MNYLSQSVRFFLVFLLLLSLNSTAFMADPNKESTEEVKKLEGKMETLQWEIKALEKKIAALKLEANNPTLKKTTSPQKETTPEVRPTSEKPKDTGFTYWNPSARRQTPIGPAVGKTPVVAPTQKSEPQKKEPAKVVSQKKPTYNPLQEARSAIGAKLFSVEGFQRILINADLKDMIVYDPKGFTIFVPLDEAMIKGISSERVLELLQSKEKAQFFSMFHILKNQRSLAELKSLHGTWIDSVNGMTIYFTVVNSDEGEHLLVNGAKIIGGPFKGNNVTIYIVDSVLTP